MVPVVNSDRSILLDAALLSRHVTQDLQVLEAKKHIPTMSNRCLLGDSSSNRNTSIDLNTAHLTIGVLRGLLVESSPQ